MVRRGGRLFVEVAGYALLDRDQVNVDPVEAHAEAMREAMRQMAASQSLVVGALPGQTVVIRYQRLPDVPRDQLAQAVETEAGQNIPYDLSEVFLDWTILDEMAEGDTKQLKALLVAAKHEVIESRVQIATAADVQFGALSVDSLAVADAAEACDMLHVGETVALVNLGASSASIHFVKDGVSNFIRDVSWGARELIQAIAKSRRCDYDEAEKQLRLAIDKAGQHQEEATVEAAPVEEESSGLDNLPDDFGDSLLDPLGDEEMGGGSSSGGAGGGGGSLLDPLDDELGDLGGPAPKPMDAGVGDFGMGGTPGQGADMSEVLSLPISRLVAEVRRSLDYYEHQLYEHPVNRIILSGGVAHLPWLRDALLDEIEVDSVEVADPAVGGLSLGDEYSVGALLEHPAQFMVAVGLAARGVAEL